jgi:N-acetylglucosamine-6-phosphate deacetylase
MLYKAYLNRSEAINMASLHPAELLGLADKGIGTLAEGLRQILLYMSIGKLDHG